MKIGAWSDWTMDRWVLLVFVLAGLGDGVFPRLPVHAESPPTLATDHKDWSMYNYDVMGSRYNRGEETLVPKRVPELVEKWRFPGRKSRGKVGVIHATPTVVNGHVYFGTATYPAFYKLKPNGQPAWIYRPYGVSRQGLTLRNPIREMVANRIAAERGILGSALVTDKRVFFGDVAGVFYALDRFTGEELWKVDSRAQGFPGAHVANTFMSSPILVQGRVVVGGGGFEHGQALDPSYACCSGRGFVLAFEPATGNIAWKYDVGPRPVRFDQPVVISDAKGEHTFTHGPSTSSVWSTPSYHAGTSTIFFGTDVHNSPRQPTPEDPRLYNKYSSAVIALDASSGKEKWVKQINRGDIFNYAMSSYDSKTNRYKDMSIGDTPKIYTIQVQGQDVLVVGVGCKNGGYYVLRSDDGQLVNQTPIYRGKPKYPLDPPPDPRVIALPSPIGGIQTGCATDGKRVFTNGIDFLRMGHGVPTAGRVVSLHLDASQEFWRHERPAPGTPSQAGDPVAAGIAVAAGVVYFTTTASHRLVAVEASSGRVLKEIQLDTLWTGPSVSRGRVYVGTGSILFLGRKYTGTLHSFGLPGEDEVSRLGAGDETTQ
jgi:polyvinyl alcohol dehydrogenase (cytochrome)